MRSFNVFATLATFISVSALARGTRRVTRKQEPILFQETFGSDRTVLRAPNALTPSYAVTSLGPTIFEKQAYKLWSLSGDARVSKWEDDPAEPLSFFKASQGFTEIRYHVKRASAAACVGDHLSCVGRSKAVAVVPPYITFKDFKCSFGSRGYDCKRISNKKVVLKTRHAQGTNYIFKMYQFGSDVDDLATVILTLIHAKREPEYLKKAVDLQEKFRGRRTVHG